MHKQIDIRRYPPGSISHLSHLSSSMETNACSNFIMINKSLRPNNIASPFSPKTNFAEIKLRSIVFGFDYPIALDTSKIDSHPLSSACTKPVQTVSHLRPPNPTRSPQNLTIPTQHRYVYSKSTPIRYTYTSPRCCYMRTLKNVYQNFSYNMHPTAKDKPFSRKTKEAK